MTFPLLLCALIALFSGLHFGRRFAQAHRSGGNIVLPALAHGVIAAPLMVLTVLLDPTEASMLWMAVALTALMSLAMGALLPAPAAARAERRNVALAPQRVPETPARSSSAA
ncbi:hypothetical protein GCM10008959_33370 [Deinococcus seoulensis]|uniref:Uncharacterized protein n=2 Tax=Deinococcus TaxID=1298 RepID=A0ABQ2RYB0_9DEIO|nr:MULTISPECIES: hypothetical protein [Deinococcus]GGR68568.1 hypothetical protein GCM10008959_33370 [Deinococcus seoulensis]GGS27189.1 hypothetical protein GCM10008961_18480 [Deinococcus knuensis]